MLALYNGISDGDAAAEADRWIKGAAQVVEPPPEDIFRSAKLALAFEKLLDEEEATVMTVDCYGTMWDKTIKLPAYPCLGFARLNNMGLGGICESDLRSAMTHIIFQGLVGRPGFVSDPTVDESTGSIILAHCMGTPRMDGPGKPAAPYKIRTVMERQEGVVPQVEMRVGERVTQAMLVGHGHDALFHRDGDRGAGRTRGRPRLPDQDRRQGRRRYHPALAELDGRAPPPDGLRRYHGKSSAFSPGSRRSD